MCSREKDIKKLKKNNKDSQLRSISLQDDLLARLKAAANIKFDKIIEGIEELKEILMISFLILQEILNLFNMILSLLILWIIARKNFWLIAIINQFFKLN